MGVDVIKKAEAFQPPLLITTIPPLKNDDLWLRWQREKDSNPHIRSQSPLCYLYTIPLCS